MFFDKYKEMNKDDQVPFSMETTAEQVESLYKGTQRFLCEVVRLREAKMNEMEAGGKNIVPLFTQTQALRTLLEEGWY